MAIGDYYPVDGCQDYYYLDTGMYDTERYGAVYIVDAERPAVIDTGIGTNYEFILSAMAEIGITPEELAVIAPTHIHLDHAGGAGYLAAECPNAEIHVHEIGAPHLVDPERLIAGTKAAVEDQWEYYAEPKPVPEERITELSGGDTIDLGDRTLEVYHAPGHAPHQVIYYDPDAAVVATGDAAGIWVPQLETVRQTSPPANFDLEACLDDGETIRALDSDTLLFGHFGPAEASDELLDTYKQVLSEWVGAVEEKRGELDDEAVIEYFVENTEMAEVWGERKARAEERLNTRGVLGYLDASAESDQ
ncbi:MBL fold metallo-hydrolase [Halalkalicoccus jeotgali]|uniref:Probable metallo-beta-lactamase family hydrolase n=1 Tax=Halalkalicoccus jeotgali (strain DSM 18796 / CECT 7217 / JCM 14584 / KCTC 4019 / B3) TaxID=795797 RepID=D8J8N7_HALJB|nr:MBL fold metallo-hydrolase [Halalkalicoccus jeotgali]ADJ14222.1 probable metallo-beta-lactamase family hydrolase [Halalkalicoccus jeotgali B3]ELY34597.1 putative metallo-beta-lactamase family hydrolase [Halalkalicoccus jeotgali B3]